MGFECHLKLGWRLRAVWAIKYSVHDKREFIYRVDASDRIIFANAAWYDFARENGDTALQPERVIGGSLWDFICNTETRHLFEVLLKRVRATGQPVTLPYRCDSPDCRRFLELEITRPAPQEIEFCSRILREERREPVRLLEDSVERTDELLVMCGWCKKVALPDNRWAEVEEAVKALQLFDAPRLPRISHGMCQGCHVAFMEDLDQVA